MYYQIKNDELLGFIQTKKPGGYSYVFDFMQDEGGTQIIVKA